MYLPGGTTYVNHRYILPGRGSLDFPAVRESRDEVKHGKPVLYIAAIVVRRSLFVLLVLLARSEDERITKNPERRIVGKRRQFACGNSDRT